VVTNQFVQELVKLDAQSQEVVQAKECQVAVLVGTKAEQCLVVHQRLVVNREYEKEALKAQDEREKRWIAIQIQDSTADHRVAFNEEYEKEVGIQIQDLP
jgi:hypothetical protein